MKLKSLALCFIISLFPFAGIAETRKSVATECFNEPTQLAMNKCVGKKHDEIENKLNNSWKKLIDTQNHYAELYPNQRQKEIKKALLYSQEQWLEFRKSHCDDLYDEIYIGGSIVSFVYAKCMIELNEDRLEQLLDIQKKVESFNN